MMNNEIINQQEKLLLLPSEIIISTMTIHCKFDVKFNIFNIVEYLPINSSQIMISDNKKRNKNNKKNVKFFNQVSINIFILQKVKPISMKLFTNGTIHLTGCKVINNVIDALIILFKNLSKISLTLDNKIQLVDNIDQLKIENIKNIKIAMINCNFTLPFHIDRLKLYHLLEKDNIICSYDSLIHAGVIIRYKYIDNKIITILVFEKGSIIITGGKHSEHILSAYNFINNYLLNNYILIKKTNINIPDSILNYFQNEKIIKSIMQNA